MLQIEQASFAEQSAVSRRTGWTVVAALFLFMAINFADKAVIGLVAVPMMRDMGLSAAQMGVVGSAFFVLFAASGIGFGYVANRIGLTWLLAGIALTWSAAQLPMLWSTSFGVLLACRIALGAGEGPALPLAMHVTYTCFDDRHRSLPTAIVQFGATAGIMLAGPALTFIAQRWNWRATFLTLGLAGIAWTVLWIFIRSSVGTQRFQGAHFGAPATNPATSWKSCYRHMRDATVLGVLLQSLISYAVVAAGIVWMPVYFQLGLGYPASRAGWLFGIQVLEQIPVGLALSWLSQGLMKRGVLTRHARGTLVCMACVIGGALLCLITVRLPPFSKVLIIGLATALAAQVFIFGPQLVAEVVPVSNRAPMLSLVHSLATMAGLVAPALMGRIVNVNAGARTFEASFGAIGALLAMAGLVGFVLIRPARPQQAN